MGHVVRRSLYGNCIITKEITSAFIEGPGRVGGHQMDFRSSLREAMNNFGIDKRTWEETAGVENGRRWRALISTGMDRALRCWKEKRRARS